MSVSRKKAFLGPEISAPHYVTSDDLDHYVALIEKSKQDAKALSSQKAFVDQILFQPHFIESFRSAMERLGPSVKYFHFVPRLHIGGAQLVSMHLLRAMSELIGASNIALITTETGKSDWLRSIPSGVKTLGLSNMSPSMTLHERRLMVILLITKYKPSTIHINDSPTALETIAIFGHAMSAKSKVFVSAFLNYVQGADRRSSDFELSFERFDPMFLAICLITKHISTTCVSSATWVANAFMPLMLHPPNLVLFVVSQLHAERY